MVSATCRDLANVCTGVSLAVRGTLVKGRILVNEFCLAGMAPQRPMPTLGADKYILLASDLQLGRPDISPLSAQLLADFICGYSGGAREQAFCASIVRVVLAGNTACPPEKAALSSHSQLARAEQEAAAVPVRALDQFIFQLAGAIDVDVRETYCQPIL